MVTLKITNEKFTLLLTFLKMVDSNVREYADKMIDDLKEEAECQKDVERYKYEEERRAEKAKEQAA